MLDGKEVADYVKTKQTEVLYIPLDEGLIFKLVLRLRGPSPSQDMILVAQHPRFIQNAPHLILEKAAHVFATASLRGSVPLHFQ